MIRDVLSGAGLPEQESSIVPFPMSRPELYRLYVPMDGTFFLTVYDDRGAKENGDVCVGRIQDRSSLGIDTGGEEVV
jgi:hypothetical protein